MQKEILSLRTLKYQKVNFKYFYYHRRIYQNSNNKLYFSGKGCYGGIGVDSDGRIVVLRSEKAHTRLSVIALNSGIQLTSSELSVRLRRPGAIAILPECYVAVADLAGDCIKKYRYW